MGQTESIPVNPTPFHPQMTKLKLGVVNAKETNVV